MAARNGSSPADVFDKLPPQNLEAERAVLGSMLLSQEAIDEVADVLQPRHFYADAHQRIAAVVYHLAETTWGGGIDAVTVAEELERRGELADIGGAAYLAAAPGGRAACGACPLLHGHRPRQVRAPQPAGGLHGDPARSVR